MYGPQSTTGGTGYEDGYYSTGQYPRVNVLYNFMAQDTSQISLVAGQVITVMDQDESGWWDGYNEMTGERGLFPATYVEWIDDYQPQPGPQAANLKPQKQQGYQSPPPVQMEEVQVEFKKDVKKPLIQKEEKGGGGEGGGEKKKERKTVPTRFGFYGTNWVVLNGFASFFIGIFSLITFYEATFVFGMPGLFQFWQLIVFAYVSLIGLITCIVEYNIKSRGPGTISWRTLIYILLAAPFFSTTYTIFNGILYLIAAVFFYEGTRRQEIIEAPKKAKEEHGGCCSNCNICSYYSYKVRENKIGKEIFMYTWIGINLGAFALGFALNFAAVQPGGTLQQFTFLIPYAKGFGYGLDLTCAIIVLPVCRTFIRMLYDASTQTETSSARCLRSILWLFPLDKALHFHEKTGWLILFLSFGHSLAHLINAGLRFPQVIAFYGWSPLISGFLLWVCIFFMFPAVVKNVKGGHFEIFWYSHQLFWLFFFLNLIHGRGTLGPNYWKVFLLPGLIYIGERIYREYSAYQTVSVISITNMKANVISIEFSRSAFPGGYKEGQYCYIQVPSISRGQWHPFTISSAPGDPTVTLHIKVQGKESWTKKVNDYFALMGPKGASYFELADAGANGVQIGKTVGPSGERMMLVYGPHSAPTQHCPEYPVDIIVGSGIGVTPVSATMQQIIFYRWKFNIGDSNPDHAYFAWVCNYSEIESFRWMIRTVKECQDEVADYRLKAPEVMSQKTYQVHIWVTSAPEKPADMNIVVEDDIAFWGRPRKPTGGVEKAPTQYSELDIYKTMLAPPKGNIPAKLGDIHIYNGRPNWEVLFRQVAMKHPSCNVGVAFCGNPRIGDDLKDKCREFTNPDTKLNFILHKENF